MYEEVAKRKEETTRRKDKMRQVELSTPLKGLDKGKAGEKLIKFWQELTTFGKGGLVILLLMIILAAGAPYFTWL
ncbi:MAG: hypothetical protein D5R97_02965, partial [Candidatus Syntrophonatronum acetioxidans]